MSSEYAEREQEAQAEFIAQRLTDVAERHTSWGANDDFVPPAVRGPVERAMDVDLSGTRVRTGGPIAAQIDSAGADGLARADDIHLAPGRFHPSHPDGLELIRHELVHVAQQRAGADADGTRRRSQDAPIPARRGGLQLGSCGGDGHKKVIGKLKAGDPVTHKEAVGVIDAYDDMGTKERETTIADLYSFGAPTPPLQNLLQVLTEEERVVTYAPIIKDMLQRVQSRATEAASGTSFSAMAATQGKHMESQEQARALAAAQAAAKQKGLPPPSTVSPAEVSKSHEKTVKSESKFTPQTDEWAALGSDGQKAWWPKAKAVRKSIIDLAKKEVPAMKLKESDIELDPDQIAKESVKRGMSIFALSGRPMIVGLLFIEAAKANPKYVLGPVLHEIHGHPMHGGESESFAWKLYEESTKHFPSYSRPADRRPEENLFAYPETEIYAEMIEASHATSLSTADKAKGIVGSDEPSADIMEKVGRLARNLEPSVAKAVLLGMWERFRIDPRLTPASLQLFKDAVNAQSGLKGAIP
jgi:Domain of unknown function (DUF4157)